MVSMETNLDGVVVFLDPTCPFAWITSMWLEEVERATGLGIRRELMSLSAVNEGRELDDWYRDYNERAWRPARVAAALLASPDADRWPDFYESFGKRRHIDRLRDDATNLAFTVDELGLSPRLVEAAEDSSWDDDLRRRTATALAPLKGEGGTPVLHVTDRGFFGPVLTEVPRAEHAVRLWAAIATLATTSGFSEIKGARDDELRTS
jgi:hypothetical protein